MKVKCPLESTCLLNIKSGRDYLSDNCKLGKHKYHYGDMKIENVKACDFLETQEDKTKKFFPIQYHLPPRPKPFSVENAIQKKLESLIQKPSITKMIEEKSLLSKRQSPMENLNDITPVAPKALPPVVNLEPKIEKIIAPLREEIVESAQKHQKENNKTTIATQDYEIQPSKNQFKSKFKMELE